MYSRADQLKKNVHRFFDRGQKEYRGWIFLGYDRPYTLFDPHILTLMQFSKMLYHNRSFYCESDVRNEFLDPQILDIHIFSKINRFLEGVPVQRLLFLPVKRRGVDLHEHNIE